MIDTHAHVVSDDLERYPLSPQELQQELRPWHQEAPCPTPRLLELMKSAGVHGACLVQPLSAYGYDNSYAIDCANEHRDRLVSIAYVSPNDPDPVGRLELLAQRGAGGVRISTSPGVGQVQRLDGRAVRTLVAKAKELELSILLTLQFHELDQIRALAEATADLVAVVDHCAKPDPEILHGGPAYRNASPLFDLAAFQGIHLKVTTLTLDAAQQAEGDPRPFVCSLVERFGTERIMWGSNWSMTHDRSYEALAEFGRHAFEELSESEKSECFVQTPANFFTKFESAKH